MAGKIGTSYRDAGKRRDGGEPFHRRHRKLIVALLTFVIVVPVIGTAGYAYVLNSKLNHVAKLPPSTLNEKDRPDPDKGEALNILLLGSDKGKKLPGESTTTTISEDAKAARWPAGKYRSDTLMVVHITANRKYAFLTSIPRDTLTMLYDANGVAQHQEKINAAFSEYGPMGAISTVEHLTNLRMKHIAIIDWAGFKDLSTAVGGVPVDIPDTSYDSAQHVQWQKGHYVLKGEKALQYVRQRHGLLRGDFDRINRQQNFLRAMMKKILDKGTTHNPVKLVKTVTALTANLTVDGDWSAGDMRSLALSMRGIKTEDVYFLTAPIAGTETIPVYGSIVRLQEAKTAELFGALRKDNLRDYLKKYPGDVLQSNVD